MSFHMSFRASGCEFIRSKRSSTSVVFLALRDSVQMEAGECRICLERGGQPLIVPCECSGTCKYVHRDCLEHWILARGSLTCEVCKAPYKDEAITELGRHRAEEQRRRELEWPQHDADFGDDTLLGRPLYAAPATRRLLVFSISFSLLAILSFLVQDDSVGGAYGYYGPGDSGFGGFDITDQQAEAYLAELGLRGARKGSAPAPPSSSPPSAASVGSDGEELGMLPRHDDRWPDPAPLPITSYADEPGPIGGSSSITSSGISISISSSRSSGSSGSSGSSSSGSSGLWSGAAGGLWPEHAWGTYHSYDDQPVPQPPAPPALLWRGDAFIPAEPVEALVQLIEASGCASDDGRASSVRTCELAEKVLRHIRLTREATRERHAEEEAGEAMGRLMRAFVLLCILRIVIAQQQRRRLMIDRVIWEHRQSQLSPV